MRRSISGQVLSGALLLLALIGATLLHGSDPAAAASRSARLPCVAFDESVGEYGAFVFRLREKPSACLEFIGNRPCHCTEADLTRIHWHHWGSRVARATATWHYCGTGVCIYRRAHLIAFRLRETCHVPVYTRLRLFVSAHGRGPDAPHPFRGHFNLPACAKMLPEP